MRETLPQVLDGHPAGAVVVSLFDQTVTYINRKAAAFFPGIEQAEKITDAIPNFDARQLSVLADQQDEWVIAQADDHVFIATRMPDVESYPPSAILTVHAAPMTDSSRVTMTEVHINIAFVARQSVLFDEAARDMRMALSLVHQVSDRVETLRNDLIQSMAMIANPTPIVFIEKRPGGV